MSFCMYIYGFCLAWILLALATWAGLRLRERDAAEVERRKLN
jgi:hypothetical protein